MKIVQNFRHDFVEHLRATKWFCIGWLILAALGSTLIVLFSADASKGALSILSANPIFTLGMYLFPPLLVFFLGRYFDIPEWLLPGEEGRERRTRSFLLFGAVALGQILAVAILSTGYTFLLYGIFSDREIDLLRNLMVLGNLLAGSLLVTSISLLVVSFSGKWSQTILAFLGILLLPQILFFYSTIFMEDYLFILPRSIRSYAWAPMIHNIPAGMLLQGLFRRDFFFGWLPIGYTLAAAGIYTVLAWFNFRRARITDSQNIFDHPPVKISFGILLGILVSLPSARFFLQYVMLQTRPSADVWYYAFLVCAGIAAYCFSQFFLSRPRKIFWPGILLLLAIHAVLPFWMGATIDRVVSWTPKTTEIRAINIGYLDGNYAVTLTDPNAKEVVIDALKTAQFQQKDYRVDGWGYYTREEENTKKVLAVFETENGLYPRYLTMTSKSDWERLYRVMSTDTEFRDRVFPKEYNAEQISLSAEVNYSAISYLQISQLQAVMADLTKNEEQKKEIYQALRQDIDDLGMGLLYYIVEPVWGHGIHNVAFSLEIENHSEDTPFHLEIPLGEEYFSNTLNKMLEIFYRNYPDSREEILEHLLQRDGEDGEAFTASVYTQVGEILLADTMMVSNSNQSRTLYDFLHQASDEELSSGKELVFVSLRLRKENKYLYGFFKVRDTNLPLLKE